MTWLRLLTVLFAALTSPARAGEVVPDLSSSKVEINSNFGGAELLLFGSITGDAALRESEEPLDVAVIIRGPQSLVTVRQKARVAGVWANADAITFQHVPGFYFVAATRPFELIATEELRASYELGTDKILIRPAPESAKRAPEDLEAFREALIRQKKRQRLYLDKPAEVLVKNKALFRTEIPVPATVPVGDYQARVFLFQGGRLLHTEMVPLSVDKIGLERWLFTFAQSLPFLYGIAAVLIAALAGWIASLVFRRT